MEKKVDLSYIKIDDEGYFKMSNHDLMDPFFMSIVSDGNHWMFISSNGGLSAGRKDSNHAIFPYYTDDKLTEMSETSGTKTIIRTGGKIWEPFSIRYEGLFDCSRNLYKSEFGNKIIFEEINHDLGLTFKYKWSSSNQFGFVRESTLVNSSSQSIDLEFLDGIQSIMPHGVPQELQSAYSNLVDAYKRSQLVSEVGLGIFALSAIIVDRAEPSEALKANTVWSRGLEQPTYLLSSYQVDKFRKGSILKQEEDIKARKGAYFVSQSLNLEKGEGKHWLIVANVNQGPSDVANLIQTLKTNDQIESDLIKDINYGTAQLKHLVSSSDGFQVTADDRRNVRHYSNTLFNIMRGGIIDRDYTIEKSDFDPYLQKANK